MPAGDKGAGMLKRRTCIIWPLVAFALAFGSSQVFADSDDDNRIGQYYCVVEYAVGIMSPNNGNTYAGKVDIPDDDKKFFVRIKRIERNQIVKELCAKTANSFSEALAAGNELPYHSASLYGTS